MSRVPFLGANVTRHFRSHDSLVYNVTLSNGGKLSRDGSVSTRSRSSFETSSPTIFRRHGHGTSIEPCFRLCTRFCEITCHGHCVVVFVNNDCNEYKNCCPSRSAKVCVSIRYDSAEWEPSKLLDETNLHWKHFFIPKSCN